MNQDLLMQLKGVSKTYVMGEIRVEALKESSLDIYRGEILVILGPSGSGKSTLLNLIGGMDRPSNGDIVYKNRHLSQASDQQLTQFRRHEIGFVFQFYNLISDLTAEENVALAAELVKNPLPTREVLNQVGLNSAGTIFPLNLAG